MSEVKRSTEHTLQIEDVVITTLSPESDSFSVTFKGKAYGTLPVKYDEIDDLIEAVSQIRQWHKEINMVTNVKE